MTLVPSRRTSTVSVWNRTSCGSRTAWLRPVQNTFARLVFIVTEASVIHINDTHHRGQWPDDPVGNDTRTRTQQLSPRPQPPPRLHTPHGKRAPRHWR